MQHIIIAAALLLSLLCGLWRKPWRHEFFLAGQQAGSGQVAGSILATCLGASAVFGIVGKASEIGWAAFWWLGSGSIGVFLLGLGWAGSMRRKPANITLPQWLAATYGRPARILAAVLIALLWIGVISAQLVAAGFLLRSLAGWPYAAGVTATAAIAVIYTCTGGQAAVLRTDLWQAAAIGLVLVILLLQVVIHLPDTMLSAALVRLPNQAPESADLSLFQWLSLVTVIGGMYLVGPDLYSRVMTAKNIKNARQGAFMAAPAILLCALILTFLGVSVRLIGGEAGAGPEALSWLITTMLPGSIAGLIKVALLAALLSSADTCLLTAASVLRLDLPGRGRTDCENPTGGARLLVALTGLLAAALAVFSPRIIGNIMMAYAFYAGGLLVPLLLLRFECSRSIPRPWVWSGMFMGGLIPLAGLHQNWFPAPDFMLEQAMAGMSGALVAVFFCSAGWLLARRRRPDRHRQTES